MATKLEHISHILEEVWKDLKELNDKYEEMERANESTTTLRPGDDGTTPTGSIEHTQTRNRRETDEL